MSSLLCMCRKQYNIYTDAWKQKTLSVTLVTSDVTHSRHSRHSIGDENCGDTGNSLLLWWCWWCWWCCIIMMSSKVVVAVLHNYDIINGGGGGVHNYDVINVVDLKLSLNSCFPSTHWGMLGKNKNILTIYRIVPAIVLLSLYIRYTFVRRLSLKNVQL